MLGKVPLVPFQVLDGVAAVSVELVRGIVENLGTSGAGPFEMLVHLAFRPTVIAKAVETMIEPLAHEVLDAIAPRGEADLVEEYAHPFPCKVILRLLGIPMRDEQRTLHWAIKLIELPWDPEGAIAASREFTSYLGPLVAQRRAEPTDDLISELAAVEIDGDRLDDEAIFSFARLLFPAGSDTTYKNLGSLLATVLRHPEIERLAREQPNRIPAIVEEGLRFESPVALLPRWCSKDVLLGGVHIPANSPVLFGIAAANRDPAVFPDPHRFDPERQLRASLAFGHGLHFCLGSHLARRELEVALAAALDRLPGLHLTDPENVQILDAVFRGPRELRVRFEARPGS